MKTKKQLEYDGWKQFRDGCLYRSINEHAWTLNRRTPHECLLARSGSFGKMCSQLTCKEVGQYSVEERIENKGW